jgi:hypothetical protein
LRGRLNSYESDALTATKLLACPQGPIGLIATEGQWRSRRQALNLDDSDLGLTRLGDVYRGLRKVIGGA